MNWTRAFGLFLMLIGVAWFSAEVAVHVAHSIGWSDLDADPDHRVQWMNIVLGSAVFLIGAAWATDKGHGMIDAGLDIVRRRFGGRKTPE